MVEAVKSKFRSIIGIESYSRHKVEKLLTLPNLLVFTRSHFYVQLDSDVPYYSKGRNTILGIEQY